MTVAGSAQLQVLCPESTCTQVTLDSRSGMSGFARDPSGFFSCTRTRPWTHHCRGYALSCVHPQHCENRFVQ